VPRAVPVLVAVADEAVEIRHAWRPLDRPGERAPVAIPVADTAVPAQATLRRQRVAQLLRVLFVGQILVLNLPFRQADEQKNDDALQTNNYAEHGMQQLC